MAEGAASMHLRELDFGAGTNRENQGKMIGNIYGWVIIGGENTLCLHLPNKRKSKSKVSVLRALGQKWALW